jgi:hypothetical protein
MIVNEIWNRCDDLGAAYRATIRKVADAEGLAVLAGGDGEPYRVALCWLMIETAANRQLVARYPELVSTRFPRSSLAWARCLQEGAEPPIEPGLAWLDVRGARIVPRRQRT